MVVNVPCDGWQVVARPPGGGAMGTMFALVLWCLLFVVVVFTITILVALAVIPRRSRP